MSPGPISGLGHGEHRALRRDRLLARLPRLLVTAAIALLALAGLRVVFFGDAPARVAPTVDRGPVDLAAHGLAVEIARSYLTWDAQHPERREQALEAFAGAALGGDLGLQPPGRGTQSVRWAQVVQDQEALAGGRLITVAAMTDARGLLHVSLPLRRDEQGRLALAGYPALIGAPLTSSSTEWPVRRSVQAPPLPRARARTGVAGDAARQGRRRGDRPPLQRPAGRRAASRHRGARVLSSRARARRRVRGPRRERSVRR